VIKLGLQSAPFVGLSACGYLFWDASLIIRMWRVEREKEHEEKEISMNWIWNRGSKTEEHYKTGYFMQ